MKTIFISLLLLLSLNSFTQSRKKLLKEIAQFKHGICKNTLYQTPNKTLFKLSEQYFKNKYYYVVEKDDSSITFFLEKRPPAIEEDFHTFVEHYVYVVIKPVGLSKLATIYDESRLSKRPFTGVNPAKVRGNFALDKKSFYHYLYSNICNNNIDLNEALLSKIKKYNLNVKNSKKKLLAGRDY